MTRRKRRTIMQKVDWVWGTVEKRGSRFFGAQIAKARSMNHPSVNRRKSVSDFYSIFVFSVFSVAETSPGLALFRRLLSGRFFGNLHLNRLKNHA